MRGWLFVAANCCSVLGLQHPATRQQLLQLGLALQTLAQKDPQAAAAAAPCGAAHAAQILLLLAGEKPSEEGIGHITLLGLLLLLLLLQAFMLLPCLLSSLHLVQLSNQR